MKVKTRYRLLATGFGAAMLLAALPIALVLTSPEPTRGQHFPEWQFLLGKEVFAQANGDTSIPGGIQGVARLEGRAQHQGILVLLDGGAQTFTDESGNYDFKEVSPGLRTLTFSHPQYLNIGITLAVDNGLTSIAPDVELLGGDVTNDGVIDVNDLSRIALGIIGNQNTRLPPDVNGDGTTNVRDLVFAGRNFNRTDITPSPTQMNLEHIMANFRTGNRAQVEESIDAGMTALYGGIRPVVSKGSGLSQTQKADEAIAFMEMKFVDSLIAYTKRDDADDALARRAFDMAMFVHQMNSVSKAVSQVTTKCAMGDMVAHSTDPRSAEFDKACGQLLPIFDDPVQNDNPFLAQTGEIGIYAEPFALYPSYSVALRADIIPPRWSREIPELVEVTAPISDGGCESIFKETRGLMLRLHLERFTVVRQPWVGVFDAPQGTQVPVWALEWQPAEYVRAWEACNHNGELRVSVENHVNEEEPLNFMWRFYEVGTTNN